MSGVSAGPTIRRRLCAQDFVFALDVGVEKLDKVEMVWELFPAE